MGQLARVQNPHGKEPLTPPPNPLTIYTPAGHNTNLWDRGVRGITGGPLRWTNSKRICPITIHLYLLIYFNRARAQSLARLATHSFRNTREAPSLYKLHSNLLTHSRTHSYTSFLLLDIPWT